MTRYTMRPHRRKPFRLADNQLDLFDWQALPVAPDLLPETHAERALMHRLRMPLHMARVIAENANLGGRA